MSSLSGKVALVTGASKGIGAEIARAMAHAGAAVGVNYASSRAGAEAVVSQITSKGGKAVAVGGDVANEADVVRMVGETKKAFGRLDTLVNNAGVFEFLPLEQITAEHFHRQFNINVLGLLLASREAAKHFPSSGGSIINISSVVSTLTPPNSSVYSATKGAVDTITLALAKELGPKQIRVNAINPGLVITEGVRAVGFDKPEFSDDTVRQTPLGRVGQVGDIAPAAVYLASDEARWITGETIRLSGGLR